MSANFIAVCGLPRAGSTLVCQLLAQHPDVHCEVHSSPLCNALLGMRRMLSDDQFLLSQLDRSFEAAYGHLQTGMQGFLRGWYGDTGKQAVVDKNRAWLHCVETLLAIAPEAKLIVCVRELGQIYGSIESQHQKTILLDFMDHLADYDRFGRADMLFAKDKAIGAPLISVHALQDLPDAVLQRIYVLRFEDLVDRPRECAAHLFQWLGLGAHAIDPARLSVGVQESDSHYRMKFPHRQHASIRKPAPHPIPERIQAQIESACAWYYQLYYPNKGQTAASAPPGAAGTGHAR